MGHYARRYTSSQGVQQVLDGIGALILPGQNRRFICVELKRLFVVDLLLGTVEVGNCSAIMVCTKPLVAYPKLTFPKLRFFLYRIYRTLQDIHVYPVYHFSLYLLCHFLLPPIVLNVVS
jgi:hypothetical protein